MAVTCCADRKRRGRKAGAQKNRDQFFHRANIFFLTIRVMQNGTPDPDFLFKAVTSWNYRLLLRSAAPPQTNPKG